MFGNMDSGLIIHHFESFSVTMPFRNPYDKGGSSTVTWLTLSAFASTQLLLFLFFFPLCDLVCTALLSGGSWLLDNSKVEVCFKGHQKLICGTWSVGDQSRQSPTRHITGQRKQFWYWLSNHVISQACIRLSSSGRCLAIICEQAVVRPSLNFNFAIHSAAYRSETFSVLLLSFWLFRKLEGQNWQLFVFPQSSSCLSWAISGFSSGVWTTYILIYFWLCLIYQNLQYKLQYIQPKNVPLALSMIALSNNNNTKMRIVWKANFHNEIGLDDSYYLSYQGEGGSQLGMDTSYMSVWVYGFMASINKKECSTFVILKKFFVSR